jgi:hypothetical protein
MIDKATSSFVDSFDTTQPYYSYLGRRDTSLSWTFHGLASRTRTLIEFANVLLPVVNIMSLIRGTSQGQERNGTSELLDDWATCD